MKLTDIITNGLSGWIIFLITLIMSGGFIIARRRKTTQKNIRAKGDVAGGDIRFKRTSPTKNNGKGAETKTTKQINVSAGGDVAGGDIEKPK